MAAKSNLIIVLVVLMAVIVSSQNRGSGRRNRRRERPVPVQSVPNEVSEQAELSIFESPESLSGSSTEAPETLIPSSSSRPSRSSRPPRRGRKRAQAQSVPIEIPKQAESKLSESPEPLSGLTSEASELLTSSSSSRPSNPSSKSKPSKRRRGRPEKLEQPVPNAVSVQLGSSLPDSLEPRLSPETPEPSSSLRPSRSSRRSRPSKERRKRPEKLTNAVSEQPGPLLSDSLEPSTGLSSETPGILIPSSSLRPSRSSRRSRPSKPSKRQRGRPEKLPNAVSEQPEPSLSDSLEPLKGLSLETPGTLIPSSSLRPSRSSRRSRPSKGQRGRPGKLEQPVPNAVSEKPDSLEPLPGLPSEIIEPLTPSSSSRPSRSSKRSRPSKPSKRGRGYPRKLEQPVPNAISQQPSEAPNSSSTKSTKRPSRREREERKRAQAQSIPIEIPEQAESTLSEPPEPLSDASEQLRPLGRSSSSKKRRISSNTRAKRIRKTTSTTTTKAPAINDFYRNDYNGGYEPLFDQ